MTEKQLTPETKAALFEFRRYLSDEVAPLMALDSVDKVLTLPPEVIVNQIQAWVGDQFRGPGADIPVSDYLFHALKKIHHFAELQLISEKKVMSAISDLKGPILAVCPPEDREFLEKNIELIGETSAPSSGVEVLYRQAGTEQRLATSKSPDGRRAEVEKRLSLIMERLSRMQPAAGGQASNVVPMARARVVSEAVSTAVSAANTEREVEENLDDIRSAGVDVDPRHLFRYLGNSLPEWAVPVKESISSVGSDEFPATGPQPLEAMKRFLTVSDDPDEKLRRFRQLVESSIEQFENGALGRAVTMLGLAEGLVEEGEIPEKESDKIRRAAEENLDPDRLRDYAETPETHYLFRKLLNFFPGFRAEGILRSLEEEERRDRRRHLLAVIEAHGSEAHEAALEVFGSHGDQRLGETNPYYARNLLYVLNRVPTSGRSSDREIEIAKRLSSPKFPPYLTKEAIATLGQTHHEGAEEILISRLRDYELLLSEGGKSHPSKEMRQIVDRIIAGLVKIGTDDALEAVVSHGLSEKPEYGDTLRRLSVLGSRNLYDKPELVDRLIKAVRRHLPKRVLGIVVRGKEAEEVEKLLEALAGTDTAEVLELLESIRQHYPDKPYAEKAQSILESSGVGRSTAATAPKLSGDLELFGLPNLMQNLASMELTGVLTIADREGNRVGAVAFDSGKIGRCHTGDLRGKDAFFQLFENAGSGTFSFVERSEAGKDDSDMTPMEVTPLIMEALRRFDELRLSRAIVPPESGLQATDKKPAHDPRETDPKVIREVWMKASSGEPPETWESEISVDSFRIWRLLRHWVENGALELKE